MSVWADLDALEREHKLDFLREPDLGFAWAAYRWAEGASLDEVLDETDLAAGDFVRWVKQLLDLTDQVADAAGDSGLRRTAREAIAGRPPPGRRRLLLADGLTGPQDTPGDTPGTGRKGAYRLQGPASGSVRCGDPLALAELAARIDDLRLGSPVSQRRRTSWIDQFVLRQDVNNPFVQVITSAQQLARVAEDRVGLTRAEYDDVATARYQARVLEDLARMLDEDVAAHGRRADEALAGDPETRARVLSNALIGSVRATAMLVDACHTLLGLSEKLLVIRRPVSRLMLMAAVENTRAAASTAHLTVLVNLPRITDVTLYDELAGGIDTFDITLAHANRVAAALRSEVRVAQAMPASSLR